MVITYSLIFAKAACSQFSVIQDDRVLEAKEIFLYTVSTITVVETHLQYLDWLLPTRTKIHCI